MKIEETKTYKLIYEFLGDDKESSLDWFKTPNKNFKDCTPASLVEQGQDDQLLIWARGVVDNYLSQ